MNTSAIAGTASRTKPVRPWKWAMGLISTALVVTWAVLASVMLRTEPLDYSRTRLSDNNLYRVTIVPDTDPIPVNELHTWTLHVEAMSGDLIENATITVDGDMPEHGHGLPTRPEVTQYLGNGDYLVEGMKFQMGGWWVMEFDITAGDQTDHVSFNLQLE